MTCYGAPIILPSLILGTQCPAQATTPADVNDFQPASTNQPGRAYPQVDSEGRVRARIAAPVAGKEIPGLEKQAELSADHIGHPTPPVEALNAYLHFAVIYRCRPVGLLSPRVLKNTGKPQWNDVLFNRTWQELAWKTVTHYPASGVNASSQGKK